jgi:hypothetical protein
MTESMPFETFAAWLRAFPDDESCACYATTPDGSDPDSWMHCPQSACSRPDHDHRPPLPDNRKAVVIETLRFMASGWVTGDENWQYLGDKADELERTEPDDWWCCPLCEETECDSGCPLAPLRQQYADGAHDAH